MANVLKVTKVTETNSTGHTVTASCPAGSILIGGGGKAEDGGAPAPFAGSYPNDTNDGWIVTHPGSWYGAPHNVTAYAFCLVIEGE